MGKNRKKPILMIGFLILCVAGGVTAFFMTRDKSVILHAMYVPFGEDGYIFVDQDTQSVFTVPEYGKVLDTKGQEIAFTDLKKGDLVDIYGNGMMASSYPGHYMGVTKIRLVKSGQASDADKYQSIVEQIYTPAAPGEKPTLGLQYTTELAAVDVIATMGGYRWSWEEDGEQKSETADAAHPLQMAKEDLADVIISKPVELTLGFSDAPAEVSVVRWPLDQLGTTDVSTADAMQEKVAVSGSQEEGWKIAELAPGYVYQVLGAWEQGDIAFVFYAESRS